MASLCEFVEGLSSRPAKREADETECVLRASFLGASRLRSLFDWTEGSEESHPLTEIKETLTNAESKNVATLLEKTLHILKEGQDDDTGSVHQGILF